MSSFNPRSRKGNDDGKRCCAVNSGGFNPRSRKGNDAMNVDFVVVKATVSIHVPARGTTMYFAEVARFNEVSIHVPARGTTSRGSAIYPLGYVSIHVPARGTTGSRSSCH